LALGFLFTGTFLIRYVNRHKLNLAFVTEYFVWFIVAALIGGRIVYVLMRLKEFEYNYLSVLYLWDLKFSFFGILASLILMLTYTSYKRKEDFWVWFDALFLSSLGMLFFVHICSFCSGHDYGMPTDLPWGISFEASHIPFITPIHPTQLYAALLSLMLLAYSVKRSKRTHLSGVVGSQALMIYSLGMLGIDFLRGSPSIYVKITYGVIAMLALIGFIHCTHKTHINS